MHRLKIGSLPLPRVYVCENRAEANEAKKLGIPYLVRPDGWTDERIAKLALYRTLSNKFPYIVWSKVLGVSKYEYYNAMVHSPKKVVVKADKRTNPGYDTCGCTDGDLVVTEDDEYRETAGGLEPDDHLDMTEWEDEYLDDFIGDIGYAVKIEELQALKLLPVFLDDIAKAIKVNVMNTTFMDGWNKKLECHLGSWTGGSQAPNLIVLDVSGSIPSGVAATMITLIDTLRHQANADLIITSGRSEFYPANKDLPNPDALGKLIGGCNECIQFYNILRTHVLGKHWGNVIVFGDNDSPLRADIQKDLKRVNSYYKDEDKPAVKNIGKTELSHTKIDRIMAFHTSSNKVPGYGLWAVDAAPKAVVEINTSWVDTMKKR